MNSIAVPRAGVQYVAYDRKTGAILHTYSRLDAMKNEYIEVPIEELKKSLAQDPSITGRLTDRNIDNLEVIRADSAMRASGAGLMVDPKSRTIVAKPRLQLTADRTQLAGDGADTVTIDVQAVDANGKPLRDLDDQIRMTTERGKLSERGGLIQLVRGQAKIELRSVAETVRRVIVRAESLSGRAAGGELLLEFL